MLIPPHHQLDTPGLHNRIFVWRIPQFLNSWLSHWTNVCSCGIWLVGSECVYRICLDSKVKLFTTRCLSSQISFWELLYFFCCKLITIKICMEKQILKTDLGAGGLLKSIYLKMINDIKNMFIYIQQGQRDNLQQYHELENRVLILCWKTIPKYQTVIYETYLCNCTIFVKTMRQLTAQYLYILHSEY